MLRYKIETPHTNAVGAEQYRQGIAKKGARLAQLYIENNTYAIGTPAWCWVQKPRKI